MRYKHTAFSNDFIAGCDGGLRHTSPNSENKAPGFVSESVSKNSFSQLTKRSAMKRNLIDAISFMDDQESTLDQMIQQLRYFLDSMSSFACQDALKYEYLLQVEAIKNALDAQHRGKPLFDNMYDKPLRMHIELGGVVTPLDLPQPQLRSSPAIQGFISGVCCKQTPSEKLSNECLTILMDSILQVRCEKEKLNRLLLNYKNKQTKHHSLRSVNSLTTKSRDTFSLFDFWNYLCGQWHGIINAVRMKSA